VDLDELAAIEGRLAVRFPQPYRDSLLRGVRIGDDDPDLYFQQDPNELLISNLELRMFPGTGVFAGAAWPIDHIGNDGCGNNYSICTADPQCAVWFFDHEANAFETISANLDEYFAYLADLFHRVAILRQNRAPVDPPVPAVVPDPDVTLARSKTPRESVLNPISMDEWAAFVDADADLKMRGYSAMLNPFTGGELRIEYPGLAVMQVGDRVYEFNLIFGRIVARRPAPAAIAKLEEAAVALNGRVFTGW
jgi:hypothetical protein